MQRDAKTLPLASQSKKKELCAFLGYTQHTL